MANTMRLTLQLTAIDNMSRVVSGALRNSMNSVQAAQAQARANANEARGQMMDAGMMTLGGVAALAYPLKMAANYERLRVQMDILTGSVHEGGKAYAAVLKLARDTPLTLTEVATGQTRLMGYGQSARDAAVSLKMLGDITSVTQGDLNGAIVAYGQARQEGRLLTRDLGQFVNSGVPIYTMLRRVVGEGANIKKMAEEGQISFALLQQAMEESTRTGGQFANGLERQAQTLQGTWVKFTDSIEQAAAAFGTSMIPMAKAVLTPLMSVLGTVQKSIEKYPILGQITLSLIAGFTLVTAALFAFNGVLFIANFGTYNLAGALTWLRFQLFRVKFALFTSGITLGSFTTALQLARLRIAVTAAAIWTGFVPAVIAASAAVKGWALSLVTFTRAVFALPIIGWALAIAAAIIAIGVAIYKNWDAITAFFSGMWAKFKDFLPKAKAWGAELISSIKNGIVSAAPTLFAALDGVVKFARGFFPASPAKRGAFKDLHRIKIIEQVANAVRPNALSSALGRATDTAMGAFAPAPSMAAQTVGGGTVSVNYSPTINFGGGGTSEDKQSFLDVLNSHKDEIARMVNDAVRSNERRRF
jgi:hypothetical protein